MNAKAADAACTPDPGCDLPQEFVRLRYFFGQRLGVLELSDEQAYVIGKQRFHNRWLHGAGVLCGLRAGRYDPQGTGGATTVVKVTRGAAVDRCGREVVVGWDTCVDVAAWVRERRAHNPDLADPAAEAARHLWVRLCYLECPSDPAPAPRDPCGCEDTGCETSRVREGFLLELLTVSELPAPTPHGSAHEACHGPPDDACLVLARVDLDLDAQGDVQDIAAVAHDIPERDVLWSTAALQAALSALAGPGELEQALAGGPRPGELAFSGTSATDGMLLLPVQLADDGAGVPAPLLGDPLAGVTLSVHALQGDGSWAPALSPAVTWNAAETRYELVFTGELAPGRYRLAGVASDATPVVDAAFRELLPRRFARWLRLELDAGVLSLSP